MWKGAAWASGALILIGAVALLWWFRRRHLSRKGIV
jgi:Na+-driven multidrug efflux pump